MEKIFNAIINSFIESRVGIAHNFLGDSLAKQLKNNLIKLYQNQLMDGAGTGNDKLAVFDAKVRGDMIFWLDRNHNNEHENTFFDLIDRFVLYLNQTCYAGIKSYEFHYTLYEKGSFYKKHIDQFKENGSRALFYGNVS